MAIRKDKTHVLELYDSLDFLRLPKPLIKDLGRNPALLLSNFVDKARGFTSKESSSEWFYRTVDNIGIDTGLGETAQRNARAVLRNLGLLRERRKGRDNRLEFRIAYSALGEYLEGLVTTNVVTGDDEPRHRKEHSNRTESTMVSSVEETITVPGGRSRVSVFGGRELPAAQEGKGVNPHAWYLADKEAKDRAALEKASRVPEAYQPIIDAWNKVGIKHRPGNRTMAKIVAQIRKARTGTLFKDQPDFLDECRKYSVTQIVRAIKRFGLIRNDPDYLPFDKTHIKQVALDKFFYNPFASDYKSYFATCLRNDFKLAADYKPKLTEWVAEKYNLAKGGRIDPETITRIAAKMHRYWVENERQLKHIGLRNEKTMVRKWITFLDVEIQDWGPQHFLAPGIEVQFERYVRR